jgi:manganese-dependent inorganic pyrophosphatase
MPQVAAEDGADQVLLFVVDILKEEATLLVPNEPHPADRRGDLRRHGPGDAVVLPGIMSRKKQIIPR